MPCILICLDQRSPFVLPFLLNSDTVRSSVTPTRKRHFIGVHYWRARQGRSNVIKRDDLNRRLPRGGTLLCVRSTVYSFVGWMDRCYTVLRDMALIAQTTCVVKRQLSCCLPAASLWLFACSLRLRHPPISAFNSESRAAPAAASWAAWTLAVAFL